MALRAANGTGNFSSSAIWDQVANTPTIHASTNITVTTTGQLTAGFTAPNTTNAMTGVLVLLTNKASSGSPTTLTAVLQDNGVDTASTATITLANVNTTWVYFRLAAPYTYVSTSASRYKWKFKTDTGTVGIAADSGGTLIAYMSTDDRHSVPVATEQTMIVGANNATATTVTLDGTQACGADPTSATNLRSVTNGLMITNGGTLTGDQTATHQLTTTGQILVGAGGQFNDGSVGSPLSSSYTATYIFTSATNGGCGVTVFDTGKCVLQGTPKSSTTLWKTTYSSGTGVAADPLIVADAVDWSVGDEILVAASSANATNYNETESRFIITKNSATSYVLSTTAGGAEAALTYTHTNAQIVNVGQNIVLRGTSTTINSFFNFAAQTSAGNVNIDWVRFQNIGGPLFLGVAPTQALVVGANVDFDYCCAYNHQSYGVLFGTFSTATPDTHTYTGIVTYSTLLQAGATSQGAIVLSSSTNKTLIDCMVMSNQYNGILMNSTAYSNTLTRCKVFAANVSNTSGYAGLFMASSGVCSFNSCEIHACRNVAVSFNTTPGNVFTSCLFGTKGINQTTDITLVSSSYNVNLFDGCTFGSATLISNYTNSTVGSEIKFNRLNNTNNNHRWYTKYGSAQSTGSSLADTTVRTPGSLGVRLTPEDNSSGFTWDYLISAKANSIVSFFGYLQKNATFGTSTARVELWLPGSSSADASQTLSNVTGSWQAIALSANNTSSIDGLATVKIIGITSTASAYLYVDDLNNAGDTVTNYDKMTGLDIWYQGKPSPLINPSSVSAADIWTYPTGNLTTANTTGKKLNDAADNSELAAIK